MRAASEIARLRTPGCTMAVRASGSIARMRLNLASDSSTPSPCGSAPPDKPGAGAARHDGHAELMARARGCRRPALRPRAAPPPSAAAGTASARRIRTAAYPLRARARSAPAGTRAARATTARWRSTSTAPLPSSGMRSASICAGGWAKSAGAFMTFTVSRSGRAAKAERRAGRSHKAVTRRCCHACVCAIGDHAATEDI